MSPCAQNICYGTIPGVSVARVLEYSGRDFLLAREAAWNWCGEEATATGASSPHVTAWLPQLRAQPRAWRYEAAG